MQYHAGMIEAIGNTPLIKLKKASEESGCTILGKAEFMNPGQSVKDRAALYIIKDAVEKGLLKPGGTIVEGTAGNTGIGIALVANALGYKSVIVIPETQSQEKKDMLRLAGAELIEGRAIARVSAVGAGMPSTPGSAAKMFRALAQAGINIEMIATSEVRISCVVAEDDGINALQAVHQAFGLNGESKHQAKGTESPY